MTRRVPEKISAMLIDRCPFVITGNMMPPRDEDDQDDEEEEHDDEPPVVREPDEEERLGRGDPCEPPLLSCRTALIGSQVAAA